MVKPTDTLYSVAWRYDLDVKKLAAWNQIGKPYTIQPGQYIRLIHPGSNVLTAPKPKPPNLKYSPPKEVKKTNKRPLTWLWPVKGKLLNTFSFNDVNKRGIDIASKVGQPVLAVAAGKVVYSGNGLTGYKNLIIIKHNSQFLSAYAQNKNLLLKEGDLVKQSQKIADMGMQPNNTYLLHFQIRKNGKPVDPLRYLPKVKQ